MAPRLLAQSVDLAITNVTVIDADRGRRDSRSVYIKGDRIVAVTPANRQAENVSFSALQTVDGSGKFLIPGLWDMHVHITYEPELTAAMPELFLSWGITSVRDTGGLLPPCYRK